MVNWDEWTTRAENATKTVKEAEAGIQNINNAIQPLLNLIKPQKADPTPEQIQRGEYGQAAGSEQNFMNASFPIPGGGGLTIPNWVPIVVIGGLAFMLLRKKGRR